MDYGLKMLPKADHYINSIKYNSFEEFSEVWKLNDNFHRIGGPAYERRIKYYNDNEIIVQEQWYLVKGKLHNENGPAKIGRIASHIGKDRYTKQYFLNGVEYSESEWEERILLNKLESIKGKLK